MCGRFTQLHLPMSILNLLGLSEIQIEENWNIAPSQVAYIFRRPFLGEYPKSSTPKFVLSPHQFGLLPSWAKPDFKTNYTFNARSETLTEKAAFKGSYKYKRCVVPINGYYEWRKEGKKKIPYYFERSDNKPFLLAGLFDILERHDAFIQSFCIITRESQGELKEFHDRMPVILPQEEATNWMYGSDPIGKYFFTNPPLKIQPKDPLARTSQEGLFDSF